MLYRKSDGEDISTNINDQLDANNILNRTYQRVENEDEVDETIEYSFNFTQDFKTEGHKLILDFQYGKSTENSNAYISDFDTFPIVLENNPERNTTDEESKDILNEIKKASFSFLRNSLFLSS